MMDVLEKGAERLMKGEAIPASFFHNAINFLQTFADHCHHNKEEKMLFPTLGEHGFPMEGGPVAVMLIEHEQGRAHVRNLLDATNTYAGGDTSAIEAIHLHAHQFIELLRAHIQKEDNILFMMADAHIPQNVQQDLLARFLEEEERGEACMQKQSFLAMLESMKKEVAA